MINVQIKLCNESKPCFSSWLLFPIFIESYLYLSDSNEAAGQSFDETAPGIEGAD